MLKHKDIWKAIDLLAESHGLSASGLARKAGLDPTTFNPSKRMAGGGKMRWPSTESLAKILDCTGEDLTRISILIHGSTDPAPKQQHKQNIPVIGCAQAGKEGNFDDDGYPAGSGWDEIEFPALNNPNIYALEVSDNAMEPLYRAGDILIVDPDDTNIRRGDRVIVRTTKGEIMATQFNRLGAQKVILSSISSKNEDITLPRDNVSWIARILWVSQ